ncbi:hypothetical protein HN51_044425, partial [Arachis hypogaea]
VGRIRATPGHCEDHTLELNELHMLTFMSSTLYHRAYLRVKVHGVSYVHSCAFQS